MATDRESHEESVNSARGVLCVECEHLNPPGTQVCGKCHAELFVVCDACGRRNERIYSRCAGCRGPLRPPRWSRWVKKLFGTGVWLVLLTVELRGLNFLASSCVSDAMSVFGFTSRYL